MKILELPKKTLLAVIWLYQKCVSPLFPSCCRFYPTCSEYGRQAIDLHGFFKGSYLTIIRILKCQPFYKGNPHDEVPKKSE